MARNWSITEAHCNHQEDSTPRFQGSYDSIESVSRRSPDDYIVRNTIMDYHQHTKYHIKLANIMHSHNQFQACLILCDCALASMVKALYIQKYHVVHPSKELTMNEILNIVHTDTVPGLDIALFIGTIQHMSSIEEFNQDRTLKPNNIKKLLQRTEEILEELENRLINDIELK
ncbi:hypothetical protein NKT34_20995 [Paenibacillus polysaccharolyticus]|uniref:hypothetical protein n=1 Tax=Paenibacillus polysaccharolyticus TaxID=582692 RepID=UPI00204034F2|nr:hypothetical protein [Paenibacillus polysaccharolyticus]MCM3134079.1 hypothetical protein [Paenibacillus polysaccharolyticus]MCP1135781.1 hypothetical protein [Paenibacillus polysaccharolyticus]